MAKRFYSRKVFEKGGGKFFFLFKVFCFFLLLCLFSGLTIFVWFIKDLPRPEKFTEGDIPQSTKIYDREGKILLFEIAGEEKRTIVELKDIPVRLQQAVIVTEDADFYSHQGIDLSAIARAVLIDLKLGKPAQGASTISQQLIRCYFLTRKKTLERKTQEIILTLALEKKYSKEQILEWYLNLIPFGSNLYGVQAASQAFFRKDISNISLAESALLAALIKAPSLLWPFGENLNQLLNRKDLILERMAKAGFIAAEEKTKAQEEKLVFSENTNPIRAPHFVMLAREYLKGKYGLDFLTQKGLKIYTTLDWQLQEKSEQIVKDTVEGFKNYKANNGALVVLGAGNGQILAMVGSKDYFSQPFPENCSPGKDCLFDPQVNATLALRQPGSAFKPFIYALALKNGYTPDTILWDAKTEFNPSCPSTADSEKDSYGNDCYHPKNYDGRFRGPLTLKSSLAQSINLTSVKLFYLVGKKNILNFVEKIGISTLKDTERYGLSLVLGGGEVKLLEMASAYSVFAREGLWTASSFILKIEDSKGNIIEENKKTPLRVFEVTASRQLNAILSNNDLRAPMFGRNSYLYFADYEVAAKTGTTQNHNDAWAIGYTPSVVVGAWVGNNDNSPMTERPGVVSAGLIFHRVMGELLKALPREEFEKPNEVLTGKPVLDGEVQTPHHSILYYIDKNNPQGPPPQSPSDDPQYRNWEEAVISY